MPNTMRWRYGDTNPVTLPVDAETVVEIGDLVYLEGGLAHPAGAQDDLGTEAENQEALHDAFVGVAMQHSPAGSAGTVRIATSGVFELASPSAAYGLGQLVGADENGGGTAVLNQTVAAVATPNLAVGRVARQELAATTRVLVEIVSTVLRGGPQAAA